MILRDIITHKPGICKQEVAKVLTLSYVTPVFQGAGNISGAHFLFIQLALLPSGAFAADGAGVAGALTLVGIAAVQAAPNGGLLLVVERMV